MQFTKQIIGHHVLVGDFAFLAQALLLYLPYEWITRRGMYHGSFICFVCDIYGAQDAYIAVNDYQLCRDVLIQGLKEEDK